MTTERQIIAAFAEAALEREDALVEEMHRRMGAVVPALDFTVHPELAAVADASTRAVFRAGFEAIVAGAAPADMPSEARTEARVFARLGISLDDLMGSYRESHVQVWELAIEAVEAAEASREVRAAALRRVTRVMYDLLDLAMTVLRREYRDAETSLDRGAEQRRLRIVTQTLRGELDELPGVAYALAGEHVALVASGPDPLAALAFARRPGTAFLVVSLDDGIAWAWTRPPVDLAAAAPPAPGSALGVGEPGEGAAGFRRSHAQAQRAHALAAATGRPSVRYRQLALDALALLNTVEARRFVAEEIGPLLGEEPRLGRLRRTLAAYLDCGQRSAAAAARLQMSARTASHQVGVVEKLLGAPVHARATELAVALRWAAVLGMVPPDELVAETGNDGRSSSPNT